VFWDPGRKIDGVLDQSMETK